MGQMRFVAPRAEQITPHAVQCAYLAGMDGIPWECRNEWQAPLLIVQRDARESGNLHIPWQVAGCGELMLSTASLMERSRPYLLPLELARGAITRLRNQAAAWEAAGMNVPQEFRDKLAHAQQLFSRAAIGQDQLLEASEQADRALAEAMAALRLLGQQYTQQVLQLRRASQGHAGAIWGVRPEIVPPTPASSQALVSAFNTVAITPWWKEIEPETGQRQWHATDALVQWAIDHGLRICLGPLLQLDRHNLPDWTYLWDFDDLQNYVARQLEAVVQRYRGKAHLWHVAARMNVPGAVNLSEEQHLRLTVDALDIVRSLDPRTPAIVSFDQPWGEYLAQKEQDLTPLHFADTLVRGDLGVAGVGLELNLGYWPGGTLSRDLLEINRQLDRWTLLGVPLVIFLTAPSSDEPDRQAQHAARPAVCLTTGKCTPQTQRELAEWLLPLLAAKHAVQAVIWNQTFDHLPHDFPHAGLIDHQGWTKPLLQLITELRREYAS